MKSLWKWIAGTAFLVAIVSLAAPNPAPAVLSMDFRHVSTASDLDQLTRLSPWLRTIRQSGGAFDPALGAWTAAHHLPYGQGALILALRRDQIAADLALTLVYEENSDGDFIVQLWDDRDTILAPDLFSNILAAGRDAKTDTFILDLARYPTATQVVLRRLQGEIRLYGLVLSPVACEMPLADGCDAYELALQLDHRITAQSPLVRAANQLLPRNPVDWTERTVQQPVDVTAHNPYAREALADDTYPAYVPAAAPLDGSLTLRFTASSLFAVIDMLRLLNAYHPGARGEAIRSLSSEDALRSFLDGETSLCMTSIPMSLAERERFFRSRGYPVLELPAALDPILVLVHRDNPLDALTLPQLDAIFGTELRSGAESPILHWRDLGLGGKWSDAPIALWGGSPQTGTSRLFRQMALQNGPLQPRLMNDPFNMYLGVLLHVSEDPFAIGFLNAQHGTDGAKALALSPPACTSTSMPATLPTWTPSSSNSSTSSIAAAARSCLPAATRPRSPPPRSATSAPASAFDPMPGQPSFWGDDIPLDSHIIEIRIRSVDQLFDSRDPSPFIAKDLDDDAQQYIVASAGEVSPRLPLALAIHLPASASTLDTPRDIGEALREHFVRQSGFARLRLRDLIHDGWISLAIGLAFLSAALAAASALGRWTNTSTAAAIFREGLVIGGWVAMWRPIQIFLYDWWPIRDDRRLFDRLSRMPVHIVFDPPPEPTAS